MVRSETKVINMHIEDCQTIASHTVSLNNTLDYTKLINLNYVICIHLNTAS